MSGRRLPAPLLDPKIDLVFKRIFTRSPELLLDLVNAVRQEEPPLVELSILNPQITPEDVKRKFITLDILARDANGKLLNVEMQTQPHAGWTSRVVYYLARILGGQLQAGDDYLHLRPVIGIYLMDFNLFPEPEQGHWRFELRDHQRPEVVLDRNLQLHLVEMPKLDQWVRKQKGDQGASKINPSLADWMAWFRHWDEDNIMQQIQHPPIQKAQQDLRALAASEEEWFRELARERAMIEEAAAKAEARRALNEAIATAKAEMKEALKAEMAAAKAEMAAAKAEMEVAKAEMEAAKAAANAATVTAVEVAAVSAEVKLLRRLLRAKFGQLPALVEQQLKQADSEQLEQWADNILVAERLEQVFSPH